MKVCEPTRYEKNIRLEILEKKRFSRNICCFAGKAEVGKWLYQSIEKMKNSLAFRNDFALRNWGEDG